MGVVKKRMIVAVVIFALLAVAGTAHAEKIVDLVQNGGFEQVGEMKREKPWYVYHTGELRLTRDRNEVHSGAQAAHFEWREHMRGAYSALCHTTIPVVPGTPYTLTFWARGKGTVSAWFIQISATGQSSGNDQGQAFKLQPDKWQKFQRQFTPRDGIVGMSIFLAVGENSVVNFDDVSFTFDAEAYPPPQKPEKTITPKLRGTNCKIELLVNGKAVTQSLTVGHGEYVLAIRTPTTGNAPAVTGEIGFGDFRIPLGRGWKAAPLPKDNNWTKAGFDDRAWAPAKVSGKGIWDSAGSRQVALRKVVLWRGKQWIPYVRDRIFLPQGATQSWMCKLLGWAGEPMFTKTPSDVWTLYLEVPAFVKPLPKSDVYGSSCYANVHPREIKETSFTKKGKEYIRYAVRYGVQDARADVNSSFSVLYFKIDANAPLGDGEYTWRYWREANGNQTDLPEEVPIIVTGPINGRQCKYFELWYTKPPVIAGGGYSPFSKAEREALTEDLLASGMTRTYLTNYFLDDPAKDDLRQYWRGLSDKGVRFAYGWNDGMNWPFRITEEDYDWRKHRPARGRFYNGDLKKFKDSIGFAFDAYIKGKSKMGIFCQEYVATSVEHYEKLLQKYSDIRKEFPGVYLLFWDWEYNTPGNSCFCPTCKEAFGKFAKVAKAAQLSDEELVTKYPKQWKKFRIDQSVRHATHVINLFRKIGVEMTVWPGHFEGGEFETQHLKGIMKEGHISWPGGLPPDRTMRTDMVDGIGGLWARKMPSTKIKGQIIVSWYPKAVLDERRYKAYTITMAIATRGGGYEFWNGMNEPGSAGMRYFVGEATRMIADFDEFYLRDGKYTHEGFSSNLDDVDFYVIQRPDKKRALVFAYNDKDKAKAATITCKHPDAEVRVWPGTKWQKAGEFKFEIPPVDILALEYRY